jgi:prolyl-tRNA synthetase
MLPLGEVHTPSQRTIDEVCAFLKTKPSQMIKTLLYSAYGADLDTIKDRQTKELHDLVHKTGLRRAGATPTAYPVLDVVVCVRGDHEVNENKLKRLFPSCTIELASPEKIRSMTGADVGFAGPHALKGPCHLIIDQAVSVMRNGATGACKTDYHAINMNPGRDFPLKGENVVIADVRTVVDSDLSPTGSGSPMRLKKAIEVGHVFKLGTKYSDSLKATFLDNDGKPKSFIMGCYGIGLNRIMAAAIEAHHDDAGIIWPASIAPFSVLIVALDPREKEVMDIAERIYNELTAAGIDVLFDDRDERAGFKFKDADLIGIPLRITVGRKALAEGVVELKERAKPEVEKLAPSAIAKRTVEIARKGH